MRRRSRSFVAWLLTAVALPIAGTVAAPSARAALTGAEQIALLNAQRAGHALPADIREEPTWSEACRKHMEYIALTGQFGHGESGPHRTDDGAWGGDHAVLVSRDDAMLASGDNAFEFAPIHLSQMLSPFIARSGASGGCLVTIGDLEPLDQGPATPRAFPAPRTFSYPGDGVAGVRTGEGSSEWPYVPAAAVGLNDPGDVTRSSSSGPHLYFFYAGPEGYFGSKGRITAASLTGPTGPVDVRWVDNATPAPAPFTGVVGDLLAPGGIVIPVRPLTPGTTYVASVAYDPDGGEPVVRTWTFTTAGTAPPTRPPGVPGVPNPPAGTPLPKLDTSPSVATVTRVDGLKLRSRWVSFKATLTGRVRLVVRRTVKRKNGSVRSEMRLKKTVRVKQGKVTKVSAARTFPKGDYEVTLARADSKVVYARSTLTR